MSYQWSSEDPRFTVGKRRNIVIHTGDDALLGYVETKHGWTIKTTHTYKRYQFISANDNWPDHWLWIDIPEKQ